MDGKGELDRVGGDELILLLGGDGLILRRGCER